MATSRDCKHSKSILCSDHSCCARCGWSPAEIRRRRQYIERHRSNVGMLKAKQEESTPDEIIRIQPKNRAVRVRAINLETGETEVYKSMKEAERTGKFREEGIRQVLIGGRSHHRGWKFERVVE